jgi:hypothetical protein
MKLPTRHTISGIIMGLALLALIGSCIAALQGCTGSPEYIGIGFHYTTTPPTRQAPKPPPEPTPIASTPPVTRPDPTQLPRP